MAEVPPEDRRSVREGPRPIAARGSEPYPEAPWLISRQRLLYLALFNSPLIAALAILFRSFISSLPGPWAALGGALGHPAIWILLIVEAVSGLFWLAIAAELRRMEGSKLVTIFTQRLFDEWYEKRLAEEWARYRQGHSEYGPLIAGELRINQEEYRLPQALFADLILRPALIRPLCSVTAEELRQDRRLFASFLDYHLDEFNAALLRLRAGAAAGPKGTQ